MSIQEYVDAMLDEGEVSGGYQLSPQIMAKIGEFNAQVYELAEKFGIKILQFELALSEIDE